MRARRNARQRAQALHGSAVIGAAGKTTSHTALNRPSLREYYRVFGVVGLCGDPGELEVFHDRCVFLSGPAGVCHSCNLIRGGGPLDRNDRLARVHAPEAGNGNTIACPVNSVWPGTAVAGRSASASRRNATIRGASGIALGVAAKT